MAWRAALLPFVENSERALAAGNSWAWAELLKRGIMPATCRRFRVGYNPHRLDFPGLGIRAVPGVTLPVFVGGDLWSVNIRTESGRPKYNRPEDSERGYGGVALYGIDNLSGKEHIVITESEFDALAVASIMDDVADVVAIRGTGNVRLLQQWRSLFHGRRVTVCFDNDRGGVEAMIKVHRHWPRWEYQLPPKDMGICDMVRARLDVRAFLERGN
jgi:DNA primase